MKRIIPRVTAIAVLALLVIYGLRSRPPSDAQIEATTKERLQEQKQKLAALARQWNCPVFDDELQKIVGTNQVYSIHIQNVLASSKRMAASGTLNDLVQTSNRIVAIFSIDQHPYSSKWDCYAALECSTNSLGVLATTRGKWDLVFDVSKYGPVDDSGTDESMSLLNYQTGILIEGKLVAQELEISDSQPILGSPSWLTAWWPLAVVCGSCLCMALVLSLFERRAAKTTHVSEATRPDDPGPIIDAEIKD